MKLKQMMFGAVFVAALVFATATASAAPSAADYPLVPLAISGTVLYTQNDDDNVQGLSILKVSYTTASLIALLNNSKTTAGIIYASATVNGVNHATTQIPAGSYIVWNPYSEDLYITNKNTFSLAMSTISGDNELYGNSGSGQDYIGVYGLKSATLAGTETDVTSIYFGFYDNNDNEIELYGNATLTWTYGAASAGFQPVTLSVTMTGSGEDYAEINDFPAVSTSFSASGSVSKSIFPTSDVPYYVNF